LQAATPEQKILWNYIFLRFGERVAISQFYASGDLSIGELVTYSANKMYFCLEGFFAIANLGALEASTAFYDENNALQFSFNEYTRPYWDVTAAAVRYENGIMRFNNIIFSRWAPALYTRGKFIGYRIGI
jgi:hypothetical protein